MTEIGSDLTHGVQTQPSITVKVTLPGRTLRADLSRPIDISIGHALDNSDSGVRAFGIPGVQESPLTVGDFTGAVKSGASCNCFGTYIHPHGSGTHIEGIGHLTHERNSDWARFDQAVFIAELITVAPTEVGENSQFSHQGDRVITRESIEEALIGKEVPSTLIIRTLPNGPDKLERDYTGTNPPYLGVDAARLLVELGVQHVVIDLPSLDREVSPVPSHHVFFGSPNDHSGNPIPGLENEPNRPRESATITEFAYIPAGVPDGTFLLVHQVAKLPTDAVPTRPMIYKLESSWPEKQYFLGDFPDVSRYDDRQGELGRDYAVELDKRDPLAKFKSQFTLPTGLIYLDGNSLGAMPRESASEMERRADQWSTSLIAGWNQGWLSMPLDVGAKVAPLIGAKPHEVIACDNTTMNLYKTVLALLEYQYQKDPSRTDIVTQAGNFPTDLDALRNALKAAGHGGRLILVEQNGVNPIAVSDLDSKLNGNVAVVSLSHVDYKSGAMCDLKSITELAHERGVMVNADLCHSAGAVINRLHDWGVDTAEACTYKYINGGPGAPAVLYVHEDLLGKLSNPVMGWLGRSDPFAFAPEGEQAAGITKFLTGTPNINSLAPVGVSAGMLQEASMEAIREKSVKQTEYAIALWKEYLEPLGFTLETPEDPALRGSHVSIGHQEAWRITQALTDKLGVLPDFRPPNCIRLGIAPMYTTYTNIFDAVQRIRTALEGGEYLKYDADRGGKVT